MAIRSTGGRYINVCRTMIMLEESIKNALRTYVFEPIPPKKTRYGLWEVSGLIQFS